jgi:hypothetical protein
VALVSIPILCYLYIVNIETAFGVLEASGHVIEDVFSRGHLQNFVAKKEEDIPGPLMN